MPRDIDSLIDDIDRLVDEQLAAGPVDDYNVNRYDKCWHCGRDWHGIAITERVANMRALGRYDESYRIADDDSPVLCPGSEFIGPIRQPPAPRWSSIGRCHCMVVPVIDRPPRRELHFGIDLRPAWLRELEVLMMRALPADVAGCRATPDPFDMTGWYNVGLLSDSNPVADGAPSLPTNRSSPPAVDPAISGRRRNREQLRARTQQQAQAATTRQQIADRMRSRMQEIGTA